MKMSLIGNLMEYMFGSWVGDNNLLSKKMMNFIELDHF
jgi:hypothetical protein